MNGFVDKVQTFMDNQKTFNDKVQTFMEDQTKFNTMVTNQFKEHG